VTVQPPDYDALVDESTKEVERSTGFRVALVCVPLVGAGVGGFVAAKLGTTASAGRIALGALVGVVVGLLVPWIWALVRARYLATQRFFGAWAAQHGLEYVPDPPVYNDVPLLRDGDEQFAGRAFVGRLAGLDGSFYQHTRRVHHTSTDSKGNTTRTNEDTDFIVLRLELSLPGFHRLELSPRSFGSFRLFDGIESKLTANRVVELESEELAQEFKLEVDDGVDETTLRELFTPVAIEQVLASRGNGAFQHGVAFQLEGSTLVFFRKGSLTPKSLPRAEALVGAATPFVTWLAAFDSRGTPPVPMTGASS
jgi:hypothetical protein